MFKMKKVMVLMAALVLVTLLGSSAQAQQVCYNLSPYSDVIHLAYHVQNGHTNLYGNWVVPGDYTLPVVGAREANVNGGPKRVSLNATSNAGLFNGNPICAIDGVVNGAFTITCVGGSNGTATVSGTSLTPVSCADDTPRSGEPAGKSGK
jgi:hypothetical protein